MRPNNDLINWGTIASPSTAPVTSGNLSSIAQWASQMVRSSFQVVTSGTAAGTLQIQASNDIAVGLPPGQFQPTNWFNVGSATTVSGTAGAFLVGDTSAPLETSYEYLRLNWTSTATGAQTIIPIADTGVRQHQTVSTVADSAGSLNSTYFLVSSINTTSKAQKDFYVWFNINSAGVDPLVAGRTGVEVDGATGISANALATAIRAALNALTGDFAATGSTNAVIITSVAPGPLPAAVDGAAATGFTFGARTIGVVSNLNNSYFLLSDASSAHKYYVWMNVDSIGTDPAIAGRTGVEVDFAASATAATIGADLATAIAALNSTNSFTATGTTTVTVTNKVAGPFVPMSDGTAATGFAFAVTTPTGTIIARMCSKGL